MHKLVAIIGLLALGGCGANSTATSQSLGSITDAVANNCTVNLHLISGGVTASQSLDVACTPHGTTVPTPSK